MANRSADNEPPISSTPAYCLAMGREYRRRADLWEAAAIFQVQPQEQGKATVHVAHCLSDSFQRSDTLAAMNRQLHRARQTLRSSAGAAVKASETVAAIIASTAAMVTAASVLQPSVPTLSLPPQGLFAAVR